MDASQGIPVGFHMPDVNATFDQLGRQRADSERSRIADQELGLRSRALDLQESYPERSAKAALAAKYQGMILEQRFRGEASQSQALQKWSRTPGVTQDQIQEAWAQHHQQYPDIVEALGEGPPTSFEDQMAQQQAAELTQYQKAMPNLPLQRNAKGEIQVVAGYATAMTAQAAAMKAQREAQGIPDPKEAYSRELELIKSAERDKPRADATTEEIEDYQRSQTTNLAARNQLFRKYFGGAGSAGAQQPPQEPAEPETGLPVPQAQFEAYQQKAQQEGVQLIADQADFDALDSKAFYIDAADGKRYQKP